MLRFVVGTAVMIVGAGMAGLVLFRAGMTEPGAGKAQGAAPAGPPQPAADKPKGDGFASDRTGPAPLAFDGDRAIGYLQDVCKIGARISGTDGMKQQQDLLKKHFEDLGTTVSLQPFTGRQTSEGRDVAMANMVVSWHPEKTRRVILCSHYDTRPIADQEPNRRRWHDTFVSANDGGSGVALLMEMANHMKDVDLHVGVDFVLFDGEEYVFDEGDKYFLGSEEFARQYRKNKDKTHYVGAVLLDMVGGKNARFPVEQNSYWKAPELARDLWTTADALGCTAFRSQETSRFAVQDDHLPLNAAGIPTVDVIDFSYAHWHRLTDTPDKCSGDSLEQVARVLGVWVQKVK